MPIQIRRTAATVDAAPPNGSLQPGQLSVEMAALPSPRLWVGVDTPIDGTGRRLIVGPAETMTITTGGTHHVPAGIDWVFVRVPAFVTVILPQAGSVTIFDRGPYAGTFPITIQPPDARTINGSPSWVIANDWGVVEVISDGSDYATTGIVGVTGPPPPSLPEVASLWITTSGPHFIPRDIGWVFVRVAEPVTLTLPVSGHLKVMDRGPYAGQYPITIEPPAGRMINGSPGWVIANDWGTAEFIFDGENYAVG